jgi:hypothetical protein
MRWAVPDRGHPADLVHHWGEAFCCAASIRPGEAMRLPHERRANRRPERSSVMRFAAAAAALVAVGCVGIGPRSLPPVQAQFNESIARTLDEQMLLNLVRLRHRENPYFLQVGSITSQLSLTATGAVSADIPLGGGGLSTTALQPNLGLSYTVTPTVTFAPLQGTDFARALLSSVSFEVLVHLMESGWRLDHLMRVLVNRINFIPNASEMARPIPETPEFEDFIKLAEMFRALQKAHLIALDQVCLTNLGCAPETPLPPNCPQLSAAPTKEAPEKAGEDKSGREKAWVLLIRRVPGKEDLIGDVLKHLHLGNIPPCPSGKESCPPFLQYRIATVPLTHAGRTLEAPEPVWSPPSPRPIILNMRSVLNVMFYLSQAIALPSEERTQNDIPVPKSLYEDLFEVRAAHEEPKAAYVKVRYRGHWYYIARDDPSSQATFMLLSQLLSIQAGNVSVLPPALTLPAGR